MIGQTVSHYRILGQIGAGGMGTVYLAEDEALRRKVALKFLAPGAARGREGAARLLREAQAASALDHPHIATIFDIDEHEGQPFIVMAYYEGETLAEKLTRGPLPAGQVARMVAQIADALAAAHEHGIVHRDLKPSNVIVTPAGQVKVLDFGIAKIETDETSTRLTGVGSTVGTAAYMSPEQALGEAVDARSDLWSLGVVTYEMLTGTLPFRGTNSLAILEGILHGSPEPVTNQRPDAPQELQDVVKATVVRDRDRRVLRASEIRDLADACAARLTSGQQPAMAPSATRRRVAVTVAAAGAVVALALAAWFVNRNAKVRWAREQALPEVIRLVGSDRYDEARTLAFEARKYIPNDPILAEQIQVTSRSGNVESDPPGADIYYRPYGRADAAWRPLGKAPVKDAGVPRGLLEWKAEMPGREPAVDVGPGPFWPPNFAFSLFPRAEVPEGMVRIVSGSSPFHIFIPGLDHLPAVNIPDYWIDRTEVTNAAFKRFIDSGGYARRELWTEPFVKDGTRLTFDAALKLLTDSTGRPGPATWELGAFPAGQDDYPVTGVSWYEAAAYARWAGKSLPTIYHWSRAADQRLSGSVVPSSNFGGAGPVPVGSLGGMTRGGTRDMAGNVKEWCLNAAGEKRYILGGAWNEPVYMFTDADAQSPFARGATHGFRCIKVDARDALAAPLTAAVEFPSRDLRKAKPVPDAVFEAYRSLYSYDHGDLQPRVEAVDESMPEWRVEKVSYAAAYGEERVPAYLFIPRHVKPPYGVVVAFPGSGVISQRTSDARVGSNERFNFIMRSGRALLYPIYKSTHERGDVITSDYPNMTSVWRDHMIMWSKDVSRSVDYLESRSDIAKDKIGYMGFSWGAALAPVMVSLEPRFSLAVLVVGGLSLQPSLPEADTVNFAPRVKVPVLMLNGRYDFFFPTETSQQPLYDLLGTPPEQKRRVVYDTSHTIPRTEMVKEIVNWLDKYWGAAR